MPEVPENFSNLNRYHQIGYILMRPEMQADLDKLWLSQTLVMHLLDKQVEIFETSNGTKKLRRAIPHNDSQLCHALTEIADCKKIYKERYKTVFNKINSGLVARNMNALHFRDPMVPFQRLNFEQQDFSFDTFLNVQGLRPWDMNFFYLNKRGMPFDIPKFVKKIKSIGWEERACCWGMSDGIYSIPIVAHAENVRMLEGSATELLGKINFLFIKETETKSFSLSSGLRLAMKTHLLEVLKSPDALIYQCQNEVWKEADEFNSVHRGTPTASGDNGDYESAEANSSSENSSSENSSSENSSSESGEERSTSLENIEWASSENTEQTSSRGSIEVLDKKVDPEIETVSSEGLLKEEVQQTELTGTNQTNPTGYFVQVDMCPNTVSNRQFVESAEDSSGATSCISNDSVSPQQQKSIKSQRLPEIESSAQWARPNLGNMTRLTAAAAETNLTGVKRPRYLDDSGDSSYPSKKQKVDQMGSPKRELYQKMEEPSFKKTKVSGSSPFASMTMNINRNTVKLMGVPPPVVDFKASVNPMPSPLAMVNLVLVLFIYGVVETILNTKEQNSIKSSESSLVLNSEVKQNVDTKTTFFQIFCETLIIMFDDCSSIN